ncbi:hypothetical protein V7968_41695 [Nocardia vulneris]|uniref:hypothetical protein n=1 Tax=Nocardia vulneris TaxID=1141657 RepID=UPI0030CC325A
MANRLLRPVAATPNEGYHQRIRAPAEENSDAGDSARGSGHRPTSRRVDSGGALMIRVELDIRSGRPNPQWRLSSGDEAQLHGLIAAAPRAADGGSENDSEYQGFLAQLSEAETLRVQRGVIEIERDGERTYRTDADRAVERWLLATGRASLEPCDYQAVVAALWA